MYNVFYILDTAFSLEEHRLSANFFRNFQGNRLTLVWRQFHNNIVGARLFRENDLG